VTPDPLATPEGPKTISASIASEVRRAAAALAAAGVENPRLEARLLLRHVLGVSMETLIGYPERGVGEHDRAVLRPLVARRAAREPLAYVLGEREFWSLPFRLTPATLVPRPDSETLIEAALTRIEDLTRPLRILDLGTGSGCLLLALLSELPAAWGVGIDLSAAALDAARGNARLLGLDDRASWVCGNWSDAICASFDVVVSNPPYVAKGDLSRLAPEVAAFEPRLALDGGEDGLDCLRALIPALHRLASADSVVLIEIGGDQAASASALLFDHGLQDVEVIADLSGTPRCLAARPGRNEKKAWIPYGSRLLSEASRGHQATPPTGASQGTNKPADIPPRHPQVGLEKVRAHNAAEFLLNGGMFAAKTLGMR
jgi:release factor glutamine methyltransferase